MRDIESITANGSDQLFVTQLKSQVGVIQAWRWDKRKS